MNHVTPDAGALTKRTPHNSRQAKQTATKKHKAEPPHTNDKQTTERHRDTRTDTQVTHNNTPNPKQGAHAQENAPHARKPPQPHQPGTATGASRHRIRNQRHHAQQPHPPQGACSLAARNALITAQPQVKGNHHEHTPTGARPPRRRGEPPEHGRDKEKREAHAPPARAKAGNPQQAGTWTPADSRGIEPHPHNVSEPISSRTQQPCWITVQNGGNKTANTKRTQDAQQEPAHQPPQENTPRSGTNHRATRPNVGHNTRPHAPIFNRFVPPVPVARLELARPTGHPLLRRACLPFHHTGIVSAPPFSTAALVPPVGVEPTRPNGHLILSQACLPIPSQRPKKKGSGNKHEQQPRDHSAPNQRDTRTPATPPAGPTRVRGHSQPAHPDRPQLTRQHREHPSANTQAPPAHTQRTIQCRHTPLRDSTRSRAAPTCCFRSPVGVAGLEPTTSPSRRGRATKLRHTPKTGNKP